MINRKCRDVMYVMLLFDSTKFLNTTTTKALHPQVRLRGHIVQMTNPHPESSKTQFENLCMDYDLPNKISEMCFNKHDAKLLSDTRKNVN